MNFKEHLEFGFWLFIPIYLILVTIIGEVELKFEIIGFLFYLLGTVLPDFDKEDSTIRRAMYLLYLGSVSSISHSFFVKHLGFYSWPLSMGIAYISWKVLPKTKHRGIFHSIRFSFMYSLLSLPVSIILGGNLNSTLFLFLMAFFGYTIHLILDGSLKF